MTSPHVPFATVPPELQAYAAHVVARLQSLLGEALLGVYLIGSASLGGYESGFSDIDVIAVCAAPLPLETKQAIAAALDHRVLPCPARGLEFVLYARDAVTAPTKDPRFELNFNTGAGMSHRFSPGPEGEPGHWFVLDLAVARENAIPLLGPPARELLALQPRAWVLEALSALLAWHVREEPVSPNNVLNACRAWRHVEAGDWCTKRQAALWARSQLEDPTLIDAALARREGTPGPPLDAEAVRALVRRVQDALARARA